MDLDGAMLKVGGYYCCVNKDKPDRSDFSQLDGNRSDRQTGPQSKAAGETWSRKRNSCMQCSAKTCQDWLDWQLREINCYIFLAISPIFIVQGD